ncbi:nucleoid-associated protein [Vibrio cholerae]|uniref:nucleoid-associated protein n=1 Tax=Vibrio cholerae TaxID=666 RepID=UPI0011F197E9|nr:nucleoid-associated protein [Vibrio cholerae]KAA1205861.1 nucleoid-associated protein [Vibrio cholerae]
MSIILHHVVIHELVKEQHESIQDPVIKEQTLPTANATIKKLVNGIVDLYGKKDSSAQYGVFRTGDSRGRFPEAFDAYKKGNATVEEFLNVTKVAMNELYSKAESQSSSSGGYILFADYEYKGNRFFLAAMVKQKPGYKITGELKVEDLEYIDLNRLHQAAKINFNKFDVFNNADEVERNDINYLSFVSPRNNQKTAGYFILAFGCKAGAPSAKATQAVVRESVAFFKANDVLSDCANDLSKRLYEYLDRKHVSGEPAKLSEVEKIARDFFPADEADDLAEKLVAHLNSEEVAVPNEFSVNKTKLYSMSHIVYKSDDFHVTLDKGDIGQNEDARFYYDGSKLVLQDLPDDFKEMLDAHFQQEN